MYKTVSNTLSGINCYVGLPDSFAKIVVDSSGQCHTTEVVKTTLDPKWNQHYDLLVYLVLFTMCSAAH